MHTALRLLPGRRQVPGLTYTSIDSMPDYNPAWDQEPIPEFARGSPFPSNQWGTRCFTRSAARDTLREALDEPAPPISEEIRDAFLAESDDDDEYEMPPAPMEASAAPARRRPPVPFESLSLDHLNGVQQAAVVMRCRDCHWPDYHTQVADLAQTLREGVNPLSWRQIGRIFGVSGSTVAAHVSADDWTSGSFGRPPALNSEQRAQMVSFIREQFDIQKPITFSDLAEFVETELGTFLTADTLRHYVHRLEEFKVIDGVPFEADRLEADPAQIDEYFDGLQRILIDFPAAMIVNLDETGHCEWVDARLEKVIVPVEFPDGRIPVPVNRQSTRSTLLGAITADGGRLKPLVIITRETVETELYESGLTPERVMYAKQENAFITSELFAQWADQVLFPYFAGARASLGYDGHGVVLLDGCSAHLNDFIEDECLWHGIEYIFLPPHSSDQVQPMDLGIFAVQKTEAARSRPHAGLNAQSRKIIKMVDGYFHATCPDNVVGAFRRAGIASEWDPRRNCLIAKVAREGARSVRHWHFNKARITIGEEQ